MHSGRRRFAVRPNGVLGERMQDIEAFIEAAVQKGGRPMHQEILSYCEAAAISPDAFCNRFSILIARGFHVGKFDYRFCDQAMNHLWGFITTPPVFGPDKDIPEPALSIYEAFDAGEFHHQGDSADIDPVEQYTRPMIAAIVDTLGAC